MAGAPNSEPEVIDPVVITFWKFQSSKEDYIINDWIEQWNSENPQIQVDAEYIPYNDYLSTALSTAFATNSAPDVYMISAGSFLKYADAGFMFPLNDYMSDELKNDIQYGRLEAVSRNGDILGMPIEVEPVALYFNLSLFEQKGLAPPKNWEELVSVAGELNTDEMSGIILPDQPNDYQNFIYYTLFVQAGGSFDFDRATLEKPLEESLKLWRELSAYSQPVQSVIHIPSDIYLLVTNEAAMQICGYWATRQLDNRFPDFAYGVVPVPVPVDGYEKSVYGGWYQIVNPHSSNASEAARFVVWMWGEGTKRSLEWCRDASSKLPARNSVIETNPQAFASAVDRMFIDNIMPGAQPEPMLSPEIAKVFENALQRAMFSSSDIRSIAKEAADEILLIASR